MIASDADAAENHLTEMDGDNLDEIGSKQLVGGLVAIEGGPWSEWVGLSKVAQLDEMQSLPD